MAEYIELQDLIKRDLSKSYYQVQNNVTTNNATNIVFIDDYVTPPIFLVMEKQIDEYNCKLLSYVNSEDDLKKELLKTMSWVITKNNKTVANIDCIFIIDEFLDECVEGEYQVWEKRDKNLNEIFSSYEMPTVNKLYELLLSHIENYE